MEKAPLIDVFFLFFGLHVGCGPAAKLRKSNTLFAVLCQIFAEALKYVRTSNNIHVTHTCCKSMLFGLVSAKSQTLMWTLLDYACSVAKSWDTRISE